MNIQGILMTTDAALKGLDLGALDNGQLEIFNNYYNLANGSLTFDTLKDYLLITQSDANFITTIWKVFYPLGIGLMVLYMLLGMMSELSSGRKEPDIKFFAIHFMKMGLAWGLISYGPYIVGGLLSLGNYFLEKFSEINFLSESIDAKQKATYAQKLYDACKDLGWTEQIAIKSMSALIDLAGNIPTIGILMHAVGRKLELILRGGFMVVALPNIFHGDHRSGSIKFIKKFASAALLGAGIVICINIADGLTKQNLLNVLLEGGENGQFTFPTISTALNAGLYNFACIGAVSVIKTIINEALD